MGLCAGAVSAGLALSGFAGVVASAPPASAAAQAGTAAYACSGGLVPSVTLNLQFSGPDAVPEDGAARVQASVGFAPLAALAGPTATVKRVDMTFALEDPVGDVDLQFSEASIKARDWDARGGQQVMVLFQSEYPVPVADAQLPVVTEVFTFDPKSSGSTVAWRSFHSVVVTFDDGGVERVATCQAQDGGLSLISTKVTTPTAPHDAVVPANAAPIVADDQGTSGLPSGYDPSAPPPTSPASPGKQPGATTTTSATGTTSSANGRVSGGLPNLTPNGGGQGGGANGSETAAVAATDASATSGSPWMWAIIALGLLSAGAAVVIIVRGQREDKLGLDGPPSDASA